MNDQPTSEQIAKHYAACMDSVNLINGSKPDYMSNGEWIECLERNKEHLRIMLSKPYWDGYDMSQIQAAAGV